MLEKRLEWLPLSLVDAEAPERPSGGRPLNESAGLPHA